VKQKLKSLPEAKVHPPLTVGKTYEVRYTVGNGSVILSDDMKTLVMVLTERLE
jgi:hypothetical protein